MEIDKQQAESWAKQLSQHPDYQVLQRYHKIERYSPAPTDGSEIRLAAVVDVETTGLDPKRDQIIELAMVQFEYAADGRIFKILDEVDQLQAPEQPLTELVKQLTGLKDADLENQKIDHERIRQFLEPVSIVIAHNANFDRQFLEKFDPIFIDKPWGCSMNDIDWLDHGIESPKLDYLAYQFGFFYDRHRALSDTLATLHVLAQPLPQLDSSITGNECSVLSELLKQARQTHYRVWAVDSPFDSKDELKARGYRWNSGTDGRPKAWFIDTLDCESETKFLQDKIYGRSTNVKVEEITAFNRYSDRA